jgi:hypothetical protein
MRAAWIGAAAFVCAAIACADPTHDNAVSALGPEPDGRPGPTHRPGQPCVTCHGGSGPAHTAFSIGGTVFAVKDQSMPMPGVRVTITDATNKSQTLTSNSAGNFYLGSDQWQPSPPMHVQIVCDSTKPPIPMTTHIGRDGSCADCHHDPRGPESAGRVYIAGDPSDLPQGGCQ